MLYTKINQQTSGFTNQIFSFITSIILAYQRKEQIVVVDQFLDDISKETYSPISEIIDLFSLNLFLKKYSVIVVDKTLPIENIQVYYDTLDLTDNLMQFYKNNRLCIPSTLDFNTIQGDPLYGVKKTIRLFYTLQNFRFEQSYPEHRNEDIVLDLQKESSYVFGWIHSYHRNMFDDILTHITYTNQFTSKVIFLPKSRINVIHLRLEDDAITHWSNMNKMTKSVFKDTLVKKYIGLIRKHISKTDRTLLLSQSTDNQVVDFLKSEDYLFQFTEKHFKDREKNAIVDLLTSVQCNHIFIGNFNPIQLNGSSFSYYVGELLGKHVKKIQVDLDRIHNEAYLQ